jgi:hypothetical protein
MHISRWGRAYGLFDTARPHGPVDIGRTEHKTPTEIHGLKTAFGYGGSWL